LKEAPGGGGGSPPKNFYPKKERKRGLPLAPSCPRVFAEGGGAKLGACKLGEEKRVPGRSWPRVLDRGERKKEKGGGPRPVSVTCKGGGFQADAFSGQGPRAERSLKRKPTDGFPAAPAQEKKKKDYYEGKRKGFMKVR